MSEELILLDSHISSYGMRVRLALAEKGIEYLYKEEDLGNKSHLLLEMNPIYKKVPVLIHKGKPIIESMIIVEYIDEVWKDKSPVFCSDPYQKAQAKFWAQVYDTKVYPAASKALTSTNSEEREVGKKELIESFKLLEEKLGDEPYFEGKEFGLLDLLLIPSSCMFPIYKDFGKLDIEEHCPKLVAWAKRCMERETVSKSLANPAKVYEFALFMRKRLGIVD